MFFLPNIKDELLLLSISGKAYYIEENKLILGIIIFLIIIPVY